MRLDELDGESGLADTCEISKGIGVGTRSGPVRPAAGAGLGGREMGEFGSAAHREGCSVTKSE